MGFARGTSRALLVASALAWPLCARADGDPPPKKKPLPELHNYAFGSAIPLLMNRVSFGGEHIPTKHHAVTISAFGMALGITHGGPNVAKGTVFGVGGEVGYRYYAGDNGPVGPFFALSWIGGYYHSRADLYEPDPGALWYTQYGGAIDMGWGGHLEKDVVAQLALGAQRTWVDARGPLSPLAHLIVGDGVRPRILLIVGRVF